MRKPIVAPDLGCKAVALSVWYVKPGETVRAGDRVVELLLGSATFDLTSDSAGTLVEQSAWTEDMVAPGQVLGYLDGDGD
jgi:pyruvate/2-oxoglutarate dehydrogenase complex dihydrolipoamide acyltransferase (E2) component